MSKSKPIGVRFNIEETERIKEAHQLKSGQQVLNFLFDYYIASRTAMINDLKTTRQPIITSATVKASDDIDKPGIGGTAFTITFDDLRPSAIPVAPSTDCEYEENIQESPDDNAAEPISAKGLSYAAKQNLRRQLGSQFRPIDKNESPVQYAVAKDLFIRQQMQ